MFFFELRKRTKKRGEFGFSPHPLKTTLGEVGQGVNKKQNAKGLFCQFWDIIFFFCVFVFCVAWNEKFIKSKMHLSAVALKLLTNLSVSCSYSLIRRVKAKNALTLGGLLMWRLNKSVKQSTIGMFQKAIHSTVILSSRLLGSAPLAR